MQYIPAEDYVEAFELTEFGSRNHWPS
jgi:hypothetical protein